MSTPNYWVVGATWESDCLEEDFYRRGYWEMGWTDADKPGFAKKRDSIKAGDRVAVKARDGRGAKTISIKAMGIVKDVADGKVFVDWVLTGIQSRHIPSKNYFGTIHGPISDRAWISAAFCL